MKVRKNKEYSYKNKSMQNHKQDIVSSNYKQIISSPVLSDWVFPIYTCNKSEFKKDITNISGTAFYIENGLFLTASHVLDFDSKYNNCLQIGFLNQIKEGIVTMYDFQIMERYNNLDLALIECKAITEPKKKPNAFHWQHRGLKYYELIRAMGYPSGYDRDRNYTNPRAFQGSRIGSIQYKRDKIDAQCYELSFHCLRGLSGTCLIDEGYQIHGMIIGNSKEEILYFDEMIEEKVVNPDYSETYIYMKSEASYIGLALDKIEIFNTKSTFLNKTIHEYLIENNLHRCKCN